MDPERDAEQQCGRGFGDLSIDGADQLDLRPGDGARRARARRPAVRRPAQTTPNRRPLRARASPRSWVRAGGPAHAAPTRRPRPRSPGDSAGISRPVTSTPPDTARSESASDRWVVSTIAEEPPGIRASDHADEHHRTRAEIAVDRAGTRDGDCRRPTQNTEKNCDSKRSRRARPDAAQSPPRSAFRRLRRIPAAATTHEGSPTRSSPRIRARSLPRSRPPTGRLGMRRQASRSRQDNAEVVPQSGDRGRVDAELRVQLAHGGERPPLVSKRDDLAAEPGWHAGHCVELVSRGHC